MPKSNGPGNGSPTNLKVGATGNEQAPELQSKRFVNALTFDNLGDAINAARSAERVGLGWQLDGYSTVESYDGETTLDGRGYCLSTWVARFSTPEQENDLEAMIANLADILASEQRASSTDGPKLPPALALLCAIFGIDGAKLEACAARADEIPGFEAEFDAFVEAIPVEGTPEEGKSAVDAFNAFLNEQLSKLSDAPVGADVDRSTHAHDALGHLNGIDNPVDFIKQARERYGNDAVGVIEIDPITGDRRTLFGEDLDRLLANL